MRLRCGFEQKKGHMDAEIPISGGCHLFNIHVEFTCAQAGGGRENKHEGECIFHFHGHCRRQLRQPTREEFDPLVCLDITQHHTTTTHKHTTPATTQTATPGMAPNTTFVLTELHKSYIASVHPWYYSPNSQLHSGMSDFWLSLLAPVAAFWLFCALFEILDRTHWEWLEKYKIHEGLEVTSRNRVTKSRVVAAVVLQHVIQITLGYFWMDTDGKAGGPVSMHVPRMEAIAPAVLRTLEAMVGSQLAAYLWLHKAQDIVYYVYWWAIPLTQLLVGL